ncbi:MAG: NUDIX domain-containing protein [Leptospiraceae bacterium]|nr:NUDIX domain-containing protein [Leptospiraceae bacterium]
MIKKVKKYLHTRNAGILFYHRGAQGIQVLLVQRDLRPGRGCWGGSGGKQEKGESSLWQTALRETREEFGDHDIFALARAPYENTGHEPPFVDVGAPFYHFRLYLIPVAEKPSLLHWPSRLASHSREWSRADWFSILHLPPVWKRLPGLGRAVQALREQSGLLMS